MPDIAQYEVNAARNTGEWIGAPEYVGQVALSEWNKKTDTDGIHFDTFEKFTKDEMGNEPVTGETCAISVTWID